MKIQFTFECFNKAVKKEEIIGDCLKIIMHEVQRTLMGPVIPEHPPINAVFKGTKSQPIGFKQE